jgi:hypothetical protein
MDWSLYLGGSAAEAEIQTRMEDTMNGFADNLASTASSCFLVQRLRRALEEDRFIHPDVRKLARLPQDFELRDDKGRRLSGAKNEIESNPHVRRRLDECENPTCLVGQSMSLGNMDGMAMPMDSTQYNARAENNDLPGDMAYGADWNTVAPGTYDSFPTAHHEPPPTAMVGSGSTMGTGNSGPALSAPTPTSYGSMYYPRNRKLQDGGSGSYIDPYGSYPTDGAAGYWSDPMGGMYPTYEDEYSDPYHGGSQWAYDAETGTEMYTDTFNQATYQDDAYFAHSCDELTGLYHDIAADPANTGYTGGNTPAMSRTDFTSGGDMTQDYDGIMYETNVAESARMVAQTCHQEKRNITQSFRTCPEYLLHEMAVCGQKGQYINPETDQTFYQDFTDACHAATTRTGSCMGENTDRMVSDMATMGEG